jgi:hypothetical protein
MSVGRRILVGACAVIVPVSLVTIVGVGAATAKKGPSFSGAAVGTVTCSGVNVKLSFSPPAKLDSGGNSATIKGKFSGCHVTNTPAGVTETITQGKVTGSTTGTGSGCSGLAGGSSTPIHLTMAWKGTYTGNGDSGKAKFTNTTATPNGSATATDSQGNTGFEVPNPASPPSPAVTGSFAGSEANESFLFSSQSTTAILNLCEGKGLKKLSLTHGTITIP